MSCSVVSIIYQRHTRDLQIKYKFIATQVEQNTYTLVKVDQDNQCSGLEVITN